MAKYWLEATVDAVTHEIRFMDVDPGFVKLDGSISEVRFHVSKQLGSYATADLVGEVVYGFDETLSEDGYVSPLTMLSAGDEFCEYKWVIPFAFFENETWAYFAVRFKRMSGSNIVGRWTSKLKKVYVSNALAGEMEAPESEVEDLLSSLRTQINEIFTNRGSVTTGTNVNDIRAPGYYYVSGGLSLSNNPDDSPARLVVFSPTAGTAGLVQMWFDMVEPWVFYRHYRSSSTGWSDWRLMFDEDSFAYRRPNAVAGDDVDDYLAPGWYYITGSLGLAHSPSNNPSRLVVLSPATATAGLVQMWFDMIIPAVYYRVRRTTTWSEWYTMFDNTSFYMNRGNIERGQNIDEITFPGNYYSTANRGTFNSPSPYYAGRLSIPTDADANAAVIHEWTDITNNRRFIKSKRKANVPWSDWRELVSAPHIPSRFVDRYEAFLQAMRDKAARIGMSNKTVITTTNGAASTTSTARDLMRLLIACSGSEELLKVCNLPTSIISIRGVRLGDHTVDDVDPRFITTIPNYPYDQESGTVSGVEWTDNGDRSVTANGSASGDSIFWFENRTLGNDIFQLEAGMSYRLSGCPKGGSMSTYLLRIALFPAADSTADGIYYNDLGDGVIFTVPSTGDYYFNVHSEIKSGYSASNLNFRPLIERVVELNSTIIIQEDDPDHSASEIEASQTLQESYFMIIGKTGTNSSEIVTPGGESANNAINLVGVYDTPIGPVCAVILGATSKANRFRAMKKLLDIVSGVSSDSSISTCFAAIACKLPPFNGSAVCGYKPTILFEQNADVKCETQSTIKLLTALTFLDIPVDMDDWHTVVSGEITGGSGEGILRIGDRIKPRDALTSLLLISHNTASKLLANVAGEYIISHK